MRSRSDGRGSPRRTSLGWLPTGAAHRLDVGVSYGTHAVAGACIALLAPRWRHLGLALAFGWVLIPLALDADMTGYGHLAALLVGLL